MATVAVIFGGMAGFFSALVAFFLFNASWLIALGMWSLGGIGLALVLIALSSTPRQAGPDMAAEHA
ncbi:MAG: hypothetical protein K9G43_06330 [Rhodobacteraceae bacterium]|nr:hypothetical protein [Paracoccaceae bacterium]